MSLSGRPVAKHIPDRARTSGKVSVRLCDALSGLSHRDGRRREEQNGYGDQSGDDGLFGESAEDEPTATRNAEVEVAVFAHVGQMNPLDQRNCSK